MQARDFVLDVVHRTERDNLYSVQAYLESINATLHKVSEAQRPLGSRGSDSPVEIVLSRPEAVQAGKHPHREGFEVEIFASPDGDDLFIRYTVIPCDVRRALAANNDRLPGAGNVRCVQRVNVMRVREQNVIGAVNVAIDGRGIRDCGIFLFQLAWPSGFARTPIRRRTGQAGEVGIDKNMRFTISDFPSGHAKISCANFRLLWRRLGSFLSLVESRYRYRSSECERKTSEGSRHSGCLSDIPAMSTKKIPCVNIIS